MIVTADWHARKLQLREVRDALRVTQLTPGPRGALPNLHPCRTLLSNRRTLSC